MIDGPHEKLLPISIQVLIKEIELARKKAIESKQGGMGDMGGDAYHDETFALAENEFHMHTIRQDQMLGSLGSGELLERPRQFEIVEIGHTILLRFLNDPYIDKSQVVRIHLVSAGDKKALDKYGENHPTFVDQYNDGETTMIVSTSSPLGQALIGLGKGERGKYIGQDELGDPIDYKFEIGSAENALAVTPLFDLEA